jgi:hypothetical protein
LSCWEVELAGLTTTYVSRTTVRSVAKGPASDKHLFEISSNPEMNAGDVVRDKHLFEKLLDAERAFVTQFGYDERAFDEPTPFPSPPV